MNSALISLRLQLLSKGWHILPNTGKECLQFGWNGKKFLAEQITEAGIKRWDRRHNTKTTGLRIEGGLVAVDMDIDDVLIHDLLPRIKDLGFLSKITPVRTSPSLYKVMLFGRLDLEGNPEFARWASKRYYTPEQAAQKAADPNLKIKGHQVEVFGGKPTAEGNCSKQVAIYGPHPDGMYGWDAGGPELKDVTLAQLSVLTYTTIGKIFDIYDTLALAAGWVEVEPVKLTAGNDTVYDLTDDMLFDVNTGNTLRYGELDSRMRCSSSFFDPFSGGNRSKCQAFETPRHDGSIAIYDYKLLVTHYHERFKPLDTSKGLPQLKAFMDSHNIEIPEPKTLPPNAKLNDFYAFLPTHQYIYRHAGTLWPMATINSVLDKITVGQKEKKQTKKQIEAKEPIETTLVQISPSLWLDRHAAVMAMTWAPGMPQLIKAKLPCEDGWIEQYDAATFNKYQAPSVASGNPAQAMRWLEMIKHVYPDHVDHIVAFMAHRIQRPAEKINHGLVLTGTPGIGKDTMLEPLRHGVGPGNFKEVSPHDVISNNTDFMQSVVLRVSETRDLGDISRYAFYEATKTMLAAPPTMARINIKYVPQFYVPNITAVIFTTNYPADGLYLPANDRRHYVCGTEMLRSDLWDAHCMAMWAWYASGGIADVVAYLRAYDLSRFSAGAPPEKTAAFQAMVDTGRPTEENEIRDTILALDTPDVLTVSGLANEAGKTNPELLSWLHERKNSRSIARRLDECGYVPVRNAYEADGRWLVAHKRIAIYGRKELSREARYAAAEEYKQRTDTAWANVKDITEARKPSKR